MWDEFASTIPHFIGAAVEVWEWISILSHTLLDTWLLIHCIVYRVIKRGPWLSRHTHMQYQSLTTNWGITKNIGTTWRVCIHFVLWYIHGFVVFCFAVVSLSVLVGSYTAFIHTTQGCISNTVAVKRSLLCCEVILSYMGKIDYYNKTQQRGNHVHISEDALYV